MAAPDERWDRGIAMVEQLYGPGSSAAMAGVADMPLGSETVRHMFGEIWARPGLSIRDRRLLVIGATTMLGRADLLEIHLGGALAGGDLTPAQLDEIALLMLFYAGAGNSTAFHRAAEAAKAKAPPASADSRTTLD